MVGRRAPEQGMTLVELMVTMVIASIVAASTFMFFAGQQRVYETQTKMLNVQQNAWAAMEVLTRFVRTAGSGMYGCVRPVGGIVAAPPLRRTPDTPNDNSDDPPVVSGGDLSQHPNAGLRAYDIAAGQVQRIPPLWIVDQVDPNQPANTGIVSKTDVITVAFGNRSSGTTFDSSLSGGGVVSVASNVTISLPSGYAAMFQAGEFIVLVGEQGMGGNASDIGCTLLQITNSDQSNNILQHASSKWNPLANVTGMIPGGSGYGQLAPPNNMNTGVRNFGELWWVRFAVVTRLGIPVLTMERLDGSSPAGPQVLAEGIEDLQVAFACDLDANGSLTEAQGGAGANDEWILNNPGDTIRMNRAAKCNQPSAVRLTLVARSLTEDNGIDAKLNLNGPPSIENHLHTCCSQNDTTCCDQYRRRVLTTTVYPRNN